MTNRIRTRPPGGDARHTDVDTTADIVAGHLEDAAHYPGGHAAGVAYPRSEADVADIVRRHARVLPIGAQSSLTGGATPFGEVIVSTARMNQIPRMDGARVTADAGVAIAQLQDALHGIHAAYPPAPTFTGAFAGGVVATNAAGAATFKYGSTRDWVDALTVVLADGDVLDVHRGECVADDRGFVIETRERAIEVPLPRYVMPQVQKHSAGYFAAPEMDLVDLFIGAEGTLGIITAVTFRVLSPAPVTAWALIACGTEAAGIELAREIREASQRTWHTHDANGIDVAAIEHMDTRSLQVAIADGADVKLNITIPPDTELALLVQLDLPPGTDAAAAYDQVAASLAPDAPDTPLVRFCQLLDRHNVLERTEMAMPGDEKRAAQLLMFREAVPAGVNQRVGAAKRDIDPRIAKTAADMIVPFERFGEMMTLYRRGFEARGLEYAVWGHISDGNVHPNVIPRSYEDVERGKEAILEFGREVARLGGCPLAEHGVGRNPIKQRLLEQLYGADGIEQMRAVKRALDPDWKLAPGVIFDRSPDNPITRSPDNPITRSPDNPITRSPDNPITRSPDNPITR